MPLSHCERERKCTRQGNKKKEEIDRKPTEKPLCQSQDLNPWTLSPEPSALTWRPAKSF